MRHWYLLIITIFTVSCEAADGIVIETMPVWNGMSRAGVASEIGIHLVAGYGGELTLTLKTPTTQINHFATLEADVAHLLRLPVPPTDSEHVIIEAQLNGASVLHHELVYQRLPSELPVIAAVGDITPPWDNDAALSVIYPGTNALPYHDWSYAMIDLLVIDMASFQDLSPGQVDALQGYLAACGRFIGYRMSQPVIDVLAANAGCDGNFVSAAHATNQLQEQAGALLEESRPLLPSVPALRALLSQQDNQRPIIMLTAFFAGYFLILLIAAHNRYGNTWLPAIPVLATLLGLLAWSSGEVNTRLVNWAETYTGSNTARYSALLEASGNGQGEASLTLPGHLGLPGSVQHRPITLTQQSSDEGNLLMGFQTRLFSRHEFALHGSFTLEQPLAISFMDKVPVINNRNNVPAPPALLAWHGKKYSVPALSPGEHWRPPSQAEAWGSSSAEQIFREQTLRETAALLIPYSFTDAGIIKQGTNAHGYLMVRL